MTDVSADEIPVNIRETTGRLLAGEHCKKVDLLACAEWWCRNSSEDNVVTELAIFQLYFARDMPTPHERERLKDERDEARYHLREDLPSLVPDQA
jgi:hypothetical protein